MHPCHSSDCPDRLSLFAYYQIGDLFFFQRPLTSCMLQVIDRAYTCNFHAIRPRKKSEIAGLLLPVDQQSCLHQVIPMGQPAVVTQRTTQPRARPLSNRLSLPERLPSSSIVQSCPSMTHSHPYRRLRVMPRLPRPFFPLSPFLHGTTRSSKKHGKLCKRILDRRIGNHPYQAGPKCPQIRRVCHPNLLQLRTGQAPQNLRRTCRKKIAKTRARF